MAWAARLPTGHAEGRHRSPPMITIYGIVALSFMMLMYAAENRHPLFTLAFAAGCILSSVYGFASGAWPFGVVEAIWSVVAVVRYRQRHNGG